MYGEVSRNSQTAVCWVLWCFADFSRSGRGDPRDSLESSKCDAETLSSFWESSMYDVGARVFEPAVFAVKETANGWKDVL